jgi:hypothetical protein
VTITKYSRGRVMGSLVAKIVEKPNTTNLASPQVLRLPDTYLWSFTDQFIMSNLSSSIKSGSHDILQTISEYFFITTIVCLVALAIFNISGAFSENKTVNILKCDFVKGG